MICPRFVIVGTSSGVGGAHRALADGRVMVTPLSITTIKDVRLSCQSRMDAFV